MKNSRITTFFALIFAIALAVPCTFTNCARESAPTGGKIDTIPPYAIYEKPRNNSQNANPQKITIKFNEYISLENVDENCMISPVLSEKPSISVKKKKLTIDLSKQTLQPNTTYSFNFNNAILDLTEKNMVENYQYAFSTGQTIDSMRIAGSILLAENGKIPEKTYVLLYDNLSDTAFKTQKPRYITQVSKKGEFTFSNIEAKPYKIYALKDSDKDFTFNQTNEQIAFIDTVIVPTAERFMDSVWFTHIDTLRFADFPDSIQLKTVKDSFNLVERTRWSHQNIQLQMFSNEVWQQQLANSQRISEYLIACKFAARGVEHVLVEPLSAGKFHTEIASPDSLLIWLDDTIIRNNPQFVVRYPQNKHSQKTATDTIRVSESKNLPKRLLVNSSLEKNNKVFVGDTVFITLSRPLQNQDLTKIQLFEQCDTAKNSCVEIQPMIDEKFRPKYHYSQQSIIKCKEADDRFALYFSKKIDLNSVKVTLDGLPNLQDWFVCEVDSRSNSILYWLKSGTDALRLKNLALTVNFTDENGKTNTANFNNKKDVPVHKMYRTSTSHKRLQLQIHDLQKEHFAAHEPIKIVCNNPIQSLTDSLFSLVAIDDSTETSVITNVKISPNSPRTIVIEHKAQSGEQYSLLIQRQAVTDIFESSSRELSTEITANDLTQRLQQIDCQIIAMNEKPRTFALLADWKHFTQYVLAIPDSTFTDSFGDANDSISFAFQSPQMDNFGNLTLKSKDGFPAENLVFVLKSTNQKSSEIFVGKSENGNIRFMNIPSGTYSLSGFVDENGDKSWTTGCFEINRQPEKIYFHEGEISVKSGWENSVYWEE